MKRIAMITLYALTGTLLLSACGTRPASAPGELSNVSESISKDTKDAETSEHRELPKIFSRNKNETETEVNESESTGNGIAGTNQSNAAMIALDTKVYGTVTEGESAWFAFTTGHDEEAEYNITFVDATADSECLEGLLMDEYGTEIGREEAGSNGVPATISTSELESDTTYYICLYPVYSETIDYTLIVKNPNAAASGDSMGETKSENAENESGESGAVSGESEAASSESDAVNESDEIIPGTNQTDAVLLPLGTKAFGTVEGGTGAWFAFTTGDEEGAAYNVTFINETPESYYGLEGRLVDEYGTQIGEAEAASGGTPATISAKELEPNTTYYVCVYAYSDKENIDYSVVIKNPDDKTEAYKTAGTISEAIGAMSEEGSVVAGISPNDAVLLDFGIKALGTVKGGESAWFGFTTTENTEAVYNVTIVNATSDSYYGLEGCVYDEYGTRIGETEAGSGGTPATISASELESNTTYYVRLFPYSDKETIDYSIVIKSTEEKKEEQAPLVFEEPFEINETQVQFVINEATFIDEEKAKEVLKPVAEAILKYPEHSVLIAGTTATDMTQEECVDLANRRADAVKKLLMETYGVPESQLQTIGLGYELDPFERGQDRDANGKFVESEAKKNRRVVILDVDDPIARELLKNNK